MTVGHFTVERPLTPGWITKLCWSMRDRREEIRRETAEHQQFMREVEAYRMQARAAFRAVKR